MPACLFCAIASGQSPSSIVHQDDLVTAFRDTNPQAPTHVLVIPNEHIASLTEIGEAQAGLLGRLFAVANQVAAQDGIAAGGYRVVINAGRDGGQTVQHLHLHVLGGRRFHWPPG